MFHLYQPILTDEQVIALNARNGEGFEAYFRIQLLRDETEAFNRVRDAMDFYSHTADVDVDCPNAVFEVTNIGPEWPITRYGRMRSGSVGDVIISDDLTEGYICLSFGWLELTKDQINEWLASVSTRMNLGEVIASA